MSLNTDTGRYCLCAPTQSVRHASWAVFWLGEALWDELTRRYGPDSDKIVREEVRRANESASRVWHYIGCPVDADPTESVIAELA